MFHCQFGRLIDQSVSNTCNEDNINLLQPGVASTFKPLYQPFSRVTFHADEVVSSVHSGHSGARVAPTPGSVEV